MSVVPTLRKLLVLFEGHCVLGDLHFTCKGERGTHKQRHIVIPHRVVMCVGLKISLSGTHACLLHLAVPCIHKGLTLWPVYVIMNVAHVWCVH